MRSNLNELLTGPISPPSTLSGNEGEQQVNYYVLDFLQRVASGDFSPNGVQLKSSYCGVGFLPDAQLQSLLERLNVLKVMKYESYILTTFYNIPAVCF